MPQLSFIYATETRWRMIRHLVFWSLWFLFQVLLYSASPSPGLQKQSFWQRLMITWPDTLIYLIPSIFLAYMLMYLVIPKLVLPGKYLMATLSTLILIVLTATLSALLAVTVIEALRHIYAGSIYRDVVKSTGPPFYFKFGVAMLAGLRGSITVGMAAAIKLMKCFFEERQAALLLEKEKVNAELQVLKAQLHPHFLFNTLNNIYSFTQDVSDEASGMIMGLSQLLRYMLYECNKPLVSLDRELVMIHQYLALETARYDNGLDIALQIPTRHTNQLVAPLMLLPFIENAFKHGASQMAEQPWINLDLTIKDQYLSMKLINGKPPGPSNGIPGIGIANVRKRLELLYPGAHELQIREEDEMYIVNLKLKLAPDNVIAVKELNNEPAKKV
ncbi:sensor histidine kinase [Mucilaginibacter aquaedulcis]|uniref:sensor histidine kinase n=1 Tax=Mucilaginibacter aquaedulcis TaxID=1187081 RepID=UPI0025B2F3FE|nr:histidine kinase [Mucilaginibacter aquaedulcis]MDN3550237.1 histidine kinase [Mucilaginibacter aquaedulcis]